jgi:hypothetical protein
MENVMPQQRKLDYVFQKPDHRDYNFMVREELYKNQPPSSRLPLPDTDDQGAEGSCGPNAIDGMLKFQMRKQGLVVVPTSRQFTYWITRVLMGTTGEDSGVDNRTMLKALAANGYLKPEALWPYSKPLTTKPTQACFDAALPNRLSNYATVEQNVTVMKATILAGEPFLFGFTCYDQLVSDDAASTGLIANPSGREIGGHDVMFFGYDDMIKCPGASYPGSFLFLNSWNGWGMQNTGVGAISYEYATDPNQAGDFWVVNALPDIVPLPTPGKLFSLTFNAAVRKGGKVTFNATVPIPAGKYDVFPALASRMTNIGDRIAQLINIYGWRAVPFIDAILKQVPMSDQWRVKIMDMVGEALDPATEVEAS